MDAARQTHKEMYDRIRALETESARRDEQYVQILDKLDEMSSKITSALSQVSELQIKPARRWEGLADKAIWAVFAAVIAFLLAKIGL
ncbi:MAG: hypothetical protein ACLT9P_09840 [Evtepia gabavorous]